MGAYVLKSPVRMLPSFRIYKECGWCNWQSTETQHSMRDAVLYYSFGILDQTVSRDCGQSVYVQVIKHDWPFNTNGQKNRFEIEFYSSYNSTDIEYLTEDDSFERFIHELPALACYSKRNRDRPLDGWPKSSV